jgi:hypothetical protein
MATTTTSNFPVTLSNTTGHEYYTVQYRVSGTSEWTSYNTSGSTEAISGLQTNILYDFQVINVNGTTNPASAIVSSANITDPNYTVSATNNSLALSWPVQSADITAYTTTIALTSNPTVILATHNPAIAPTVTDIFTGLSSFTSYTIGIVSAIGSIFHSTVVTGVTAQTATCPNPSQVSATLQ